MLPAPFIRCLLFLALLFQQGACACGCPEHNGWVVAVESFFATTESKAVAEHKFCDLDGEDWPHVEATHCDGAAKIVYLASSTPRVVKLPPLFADGVLAASPEAVCLSADFSPTDRPSLLGSALPVRAELEVFLL